MNVNIRQQTRLKGHKGAIFSLTSGKCSDTFLSGGGDGWIVEWDLKNPNEGQLLAKAPSNIFALQYLSNNNQVIAGDMYGNLHWIDLEHPAHTKQLKHHQKGIFDILQLNDKHLLTLGGDGILSQWSIAERRPVNSVQLSSQSLRSIAFAKHKQELAIGTSDSCIYLLDSKTLSLKNTIKSAHIPSVFTVHYTPDESIILSGGRDAQLRIWDQKDLKPLFKFEKAAHWYTINTIAVHPDPNIPVIATGSRDKTIRIWDLANFKLLKVLDLQKYKGHTHSVNALFWSTYKNTLISASDDRNIILWELDINI